MSGAPATLQNDTSTARMIRMKDYENLFVPSDKDIFSNQSFLLKKSKTLDTETEKKEKRPERRTLLENVWDDDHWDEITEFHSSSSIPTLIIVACFDFVTPISKKLRERFLDVAKRYRDTWFYRLHAENAPVAAKDLKLVSYPTFIAIIGGGIVGRVITEDAREVLQFVREWRKKLVSIGSDRSRIMSFVPVQSENSDSENDDLDHETLFPEEEAIALKYEKAKKILVQKDKALRLLQKKIDVRSGRLSPAQTGYSSPIKNSNTINPALDSTNMIPNANTIKILDEAKIEEGANAEQNVIAAVEGTGSERSLALSADEDAELVLAGATKGALLTDDNSLPDDSSDLYTADVLSDLESVVTQSEWGGVDNYAKVFTSTNLLKQNSIEPNSPPFAQSRLNVKENPATPSNNIGVNKYQTALSDTLKIKQQTYLKGNVEAVDLKSNLIQNETIKQKKKKMTKAQKEELERRKRRRKKFEWELTPRDKNKLKTLIQKTGSPTETSICSEWDRESDDLSIEMGEDLEEIAEKERLATEEKERKHKKRVFRFKIFVVLLVIAFAVAIPIIIGFAVPGLLWD